MKSSEHTPLPRGRLPALDGLRALSILLVLGSHLRGPVTGRVEVYFNGWAGVDIFFVISGFLITMLLLQEEAVTGKVSLSRFYLRRFCRIFPVYYLYLLVVYAAGLASAKDIGISCLYLTDYWMALGYAGGETRPGFTFLDHLWSLAVEEQFYLLWPPLLAVAGRWGFRVGLGLIGAVWVWKAALILAGASWMRSHWAFDTRLDCLMVGCVAAFVWWRPGSQKKFEGGGAVNLALCIALLFGLQALGNPFAYGPVSGIRFIVYLFRLPLFSLVVAWFILTLIANPLSLVTRVLGNSFLSWIGRLSYSLYIWHMVAFYLCDTVFGEVKVAAGVRAWAIEGANLVCATALAACSYYWVEMPFLSLKRRWDSPREVAIPGGAGFPAARSEALSGNQLSPLVKDGP